MKSVKIALKTAATDDIHKAFEGLEAPKLRNFPNPASAIREFVNELVPFPRRNRINSTSFATDAILSDTMVINSPGISALSGGQFTGQQALQAQQFPPFSSPGQLVPIPSPPTFWEKILKFF